MADTYLNKLLGENERIVYVTRQHWIVLAGEIVSEVVLAIAYTVLIVLIATLFAFVYAWAGLVLLLLPLVSLWRDVLVWSNRKFVVTSFRVIQLSGVLNKNVIDSSLEKVNDVKLEQTMWGRMFDFGDIEILTAAEMAVNKFRRLGAPVHFKTAMLNAKERLEHAVAEPAPRAAPAPDVPTLISQLDELRKQGVLTEAEFQAKKAQLLTRL